MTVYETIVVVQGGFSALISLNKLVVALLSFLNKRNSRHKKCLFRLPMREVVLVKSM